MKKHSKKKIIESLPMIHSVDFRKLTQELWKLCYSNDVEFYDEDVDINVDNEYFMLFTAVTDNAELHGIMTVKGDKLLVELSEYDGKVLDITDSLLSDDIDTIADYIINSAHAKDAAGITEDYNGSFDTTSFIDAVNNFGVSRKQWLDFIENEAKKFIRKKEAVWEKEGWSAKDALVYGLERCDDVSYDGFDITRDEYDGLFNSLVFYIKYKSKNESLQTVNEKYYLTWYTEEEEGGPEEGGWSGRAWDVRKSLPFSSKEEAINYFNNEVVEDGDTVKEIEGGWHIKDDYGDEHLFEIETDATRGQSHEGPRTWDMYEFGYKNPVPKFDSKGNRIYESVNEKIDENWCDEKLDELREKGRDNWTEEDWEAYAYCKNANAERDYEDMYNPDIYDYDPMMLEDPAEPSVYEDDYEVWEVEEPDLMDDYEIEEEPTTEYKLVDRKTVYDSSGFTTDYSWYVDENGHHVFVFGDSDLYRPEDGEYDWEEDNEEVAREWFDNYKGFEEEEEDSEEYWS